jgi:hypothetical protein
MKHICDCCEKYFECSEQKLNEINYDRCIHLLVIKNNIGSEYFWCSKECFGNDYISDSDDELEEFIY